MRTLTLITFCLCLIGTLMGQNHSLEMSAPSHIRSIQFEQPNNDLPFPILGMGDVALLSFDDLNANEASYYYKIQHFNADWAPSNLNKSEYLDGFDDLRIQDIQNSYNTLQPYSHYRLEIPNSQTGIKLSGNYLLTIFDDNNSAVFSRRFVVYEDLITVGVATRRTRDLSLIDYAQIVQLTLQAKQNFVRDPRKEIKVVVLQNHLWHNSKTDLTPQYIIGQQWRYQYDEALRFAGGNEYHFFDTKEVRTAGGKVFSVEADTLYHSILYPDLARAQLPYTLAPDINGRYVIRTIEGYESDIEADYTWVHFSLIYKPENPNDKVYVVGQFNKEILSEENKLSRNNNSETYEGKILLKQGFYNYKYVLENSLGNTSEIKIDGSFWQTENEYSCLVYFRGFGARYDRLVGIGFGQSQNIRN